LCTLEFEVRRESYFWLLDELDLYKPKVWEYSRLNVTHNVLSKRRLKALVDGGHVRGWDDPRLLTINGSR
jgi:glutaminyl-tRNA synthetase